MEPDPWQADLLRSSDRRDTFILCSRQVGKTAVVSALLLNQALLHPDSLCIVLSHVERQSSEFVLRANQYYHALGRPVRAVKETPLHLWLANGSRIIGLPENEGGIRTYSGAKLLVIEEAAQVSDALYLTATPFLSTSQGRLVALSTPHGQRGWFYEAWESDQDYKRIRVTADQCPRIPHERLALDRARMGERWFRQEYYCSFEAAVDTVFDPEAIAASMRADVRPLWG
jgi:hypothetical protein